MNFKCSNCNYKHRVKEDSYFLKRATGSLAHGEWYKDNRGQIFYASACLRCGTIHATTGAPLQMLFGNPLRVDKVFTYDKLKEIVFEVAQKNNTEAVHALNAFNFPDIVIEALQARGYLDFLNATQSTDSDSIEDFLTHMYASSSEAKFPLDEQGKNMFAQEVKLLAENFVDTSLTNNVDPSVGTSLMAYLSHIDEAENEYGLNPNTFNFYQVISDRHLSADETLSIFDRTINNADAPLDSYFDFWDSLAKPDISKKIHDDIQHTLNIQGVQGVCSDFALSFFLYCKNFNLAPNLRRNLRRFVDDHLSQGNRNNAESPMILMVIFSYTHGYINRSDLLPVLNNAANLEESDIRKSMTDLLKNE